MRLWVFTVTVLLLVALGCGGGGNGPVELDGGEYLEPDPDAGAEPQVDGGVEPQPDAGAEPQVDGGVEPQPDAGTEPLPDGGEELPPGSDIDGDGALCPVDLAGLLAEDRDRFIQQIREQDIDEDGCLSDEDAYYAEHDPAAIAADVAEDLELIPLESPTDADVLYEQTQDTIVPVMYCGPDYASLHECALEGQAVVAHWIRRVNQWTRFHLHDDESTKSMLRVAKTWGVFRHPVYERWAQSAKALFSSSHRARRTSQGRNVVMIFKVVKDAEALDQETEEMIFQEGAGGNLMSCALRNAIDPADRFLYQYQQSPRRSLARLDTACLHGLGHSLFHGTDPVPGIGHPGTALPCIAETALEPQCRTVLANEPFNATGYPLLMGAGWATADLVTTLPNGRRLDILRYERDRFLQSPLFR